MQVVVFNSQRTFKIFPEQVEKLVCEVLAFEKCKGDEVGVHFIGVQKMRQLHGRYFQDFSLTDCISFPLQDPTPGYHSLGDVFVCPWVARAYALKQRADPYRELSLYIIHGLLHLIGYDDIKAGDRNEMRAAEQRNLDHLDLKKITLKGS